MKKISVTAASVALSLSLAVAIGGGVAVASGHGPGSHGPTSVTATGTATCTMHGIVIFAADGTVSVRGNITPSHGAGCTVATTTNGATSVTKIRNGHFTSPLTSAATPPPTSTVPSTSTTAKTCAPVPSGPLPNLASGAIAWNPRPKFATTTGISLTGGSATGTTGHLVFAYTSGAVGGGSFTTATGVTLTLTSNQTMSQLQARCAGDRFVIAVHGTITL